MSEIKQVKFTNRYVRVLDDYDALERNFGEENRNGKAMYSNAFVYFYRRFGAPINLCDEYKQLAFYFITTANPKYFLEVLFSSFGFMSAYLYSSDKKIYRKIIWEERGYIWDYHKAREEWIATQDSLYLPTDFFHNKPTKREEAKANRIYRKWQKANEAELKDVSENGKRSELFFQANKKKETELGANYPVTPPESNPNPTPIKDEAVQILDGILKELLKPVSIRDTYCNILGRVNDEDLEEIEDGE